jgi:hypothetical protein
MGADGSKGGAAPPLDIDTRVMLWFTKQLLEYGVMNTTVGDGMLPWAVITKALGPLHGLASGVTRSSSTPSSHATAADFAMLVAVLLAVPPPPPAATVAPPPTTRRGAPPPPTAETVAAQSAAAAHINLLFRAFASKDSDRMPRANLARLLDALFAATELLLLAGDPCVAAGANARAGAGAGRNDATCAVPESLGSLWEGLTATHQLTALEFQQRVQHTLPGKLTLPSH